MPRASTWCCSISRTSRTRARSTHGSGASTRGARGSRTAWSTTSSRSARPPRPGAPFNLWPFSFKFGLLGGELIYSARIHEDDSIETFLFPGVRGEPTPIRLDPLTEYARSRGMTSRALHSAAADLGIALPSTDRPSVIAAMQAAREEGTVDEEALRDRIATHVYLPRMREFHEHLPAELR